MVSFRSKKNRRTGKTTRFPLSPGEQHRRQIEEEDARMPKEIRGMMYLDECKPDNVTVQPPISITVSSGGVAGTETPSPTPSEPVVTPIAPVKKSAEYPSASLNGEWDT